MLIKIISVGIYAASFLAPFSGFEMNNPRIQEEKTESVSFYSQIALNFDEFAKDYENHFQSPWSFGTPVDSKDILDKDGKNFGEVVRFSKGYLACKNDNSIVFGPMSGMPSGWNFAEEYRYVDGDVVYFDNNRYRSIFEDSILGFKEKYSSSNVSDLFHPFDDAKTKNYKNFVIKTALCRFDAFVKDYNYKFSDFENWNTYCIEQTNDRICMTCAATDLLLTFKYSTKHDATKGLSPDALYNAIDEGMVKGSKGNSEITFVSDVNKFLNKTNTSIYLNSGTDVPGVPFIANYHEHLNAIDGHTVLVIGSAQSDAWWFFKTYWDIVVTWEQNYDSDTLKLDKENRSSLRLVDHQYQTGGYVLCKNYVALNQYN